MAARMATSQSILRTTSRPLSCTARRVAQAGSQQRGIQQGQKSGDQGTEKTHVTDKPSRDASLNVQSSAAQQGKAERASGSTNSQATSQQDARDSNKRAKEDHPEAPEPVIGMTDERGTKGH